jgi:Ca2+/Na+ antiporter
MAQNSGKKVPLSIQVAIVANILLFFSFGLRYLIIKDTGNFIGWMLIFAGLTNIILLIFNFNKKNRFFMVLNFVYAAITFIVLMDFWDNQVFRYLWLIVTLYYLISALYMLYKLNKEKKKAIPAS